LRLQLRREAQEDLDAWDGYVAAGNRLLGHVDKARIKNFVTVGGDTHTSSVAELRADYQKDGSPVVGTEFVAPPATSLQSLPQEFVDGALRNPWIHLYDITGKGYLRCEAARSQAEPGSSWVVESGRAGAHQV
jgi:alkaline phosphatase D